MKRLMFTLALVASFTAQAADTPAEALLAESKALFAQRADLAKTAELVELLAQNDSLIETADSPVKYQLRLINGRAIYFKALRTQLDKTQKLAQLEASMSQFKLAKAAQDVAEGYMWYASALGRWAETKGVTESLGRKDEMFNELNMAMTKKTFAGEEGKVVEGYGPNRVMGRMYAKLPFFAGGSRAKAKQNLDLAYASAPLFPLNVIYRAELYSSGSSEEKAEACKSLELLLNEDSKALDPDRIPENGEEFEDAAKLKSQICN